MNESAKHLTAEEVVRLLNLAPHPEGGYFRETFRDEARVVLDCAAPSAGDDHRHATAPGATRSASTAIYFLLVRGERSRWHRVDAVEVWHYYAGAPLELATKR